MSIQLHTNLYDSTFSGSYSAGLIWGPLFWDMRYVHTCLISWEDCKFNEELSCWSKSHHSLVPRGWRNRQILWQFTHNICLHTQSSHSTGQKRLLPGSYCGHLHYSMWREKDKNLPFLPFQQFFGFLLHQKCINCPLDASTVEIQL